MYGIFLGSKAPVMMGNTTSSVLGSAFNASLQCPIQEVANESLANYALGALATGGSYALSGFQLLCRLELAYSVGKAAYTSNIVQAAVGKYCPSLSTNRPRFSVREQDVRLWFLNTFGLGTQDFPEGMTFPFKNELLKFREAFYKGAHSWDAGDARTLGILDDKNPARLSSQCLYQLMPETSDNVAFIDPHFYPLWVKQRERLASGSDQVEEYPLSRGNSRELEILTMERVASILPPRLFEKDMIALPSLDFHKMGILDASPSFSIEKENSGLWSLCVLEPKKQTLTLLHPSYPEGAKKEQFLSSFEQWQRCASGFFTYIAQKQGVELPDLQIKHQAISSVSQTADGAIAILDMMHHIAENESLDMESPEDYEKHIPLRRFEYAKHLVLGEKLEPILNKPYEFRSTSETEDQTIDLTAEGSIATRVKRNGRGQKDL